MSARAVPRAVLRLTPTFLGQGTTGAFYSYAPPSCTHERKNCA
jgi:hypothetical protein